MSAPRLKASLAPQPHMPPIIRLGPSAPAAIPIKTVNRLAANMPVSARYHENRMSPRMAPSVCGMPLPRIMGKNRSTPPMTTAPKNSAKNSSGINAGCVRKNA